MNFVVVVVCRKIEENCSSISSILIKDKLFERLSEYFI